jgi:hypothetical protein
VLATGPKFRGLNPVEDDRSLRQKKNLIKTSFRGEVKPSVPCRKILRHVKEPYEYERDTCRKN